tara:strand:- start:8065 stop:9039 length:975 start_codon:yes stop_codon:yes gene_type:complete
MAVPTNTVETYNRVGIREDLADVIYNITPSEVPFMSNAAKGTASQTLYEWQTDSLEAAGANSQKEGDDYALDSRNATVRLNNNTNISAKTVGVSGSDQAVTNAGRGDELAYQMAKAGKELKRDMEFMNVGVENAKAAGSSGTARESASVGTWYGGNIPGTSTAAGNFSTNGSPSATPAGTGATAIAGGTNRTFTEALLKTGLKKCYELGGNPDVVMMSASHKQLASAFSGVATLYKNADDKTVIGAVDVYVSDFGEVSFVPNRHQQANRVDILEMDKWEIAYLRPFQTKDLASSGDNEKRLLLAEWTLVARSPNANFGIFNLTA